MELLVLTSKDFKNRNLLERITSNIVNKSRSVNAIETIYTERGTITSRHMPSIAKFKRVDEKSLDIDEIQDKLEKSSYLGIIVIIIRNNYNGDDIFDKIKETTLENNLITLEYHHNTRLWFGIEKQKKLRDKYFAGEIELDTIKKIKKPEKVKIKIDVPVDTSAEQQYIIDRAIDTNNVDDSSEDDVNIEVNDQAVDVSSQDEDDNVRTDEVTEDPVDEAEVKESEDPVENTQVEESEAKADMPPRVSVLDMEKPKELDPEVAEKIKKQHEENASKLESEVENAPAQEAPDPFADFDFDFDDDEGDDDDFEIDDEDDEPFFSSEDMESDSPPDA